MAQIEFEGEVHEFPDDFSDEDIAKALGQLAPAPPKKPSLMQNIGRAGKAILSEGPSALIEAVSGASTERGQLLRDVGSDIASEIGQDIAAIPRAIQGAIGSVSPLEPNREAAIEELTSQAPRAAAVAGSTLFGAKAEQLALSAGKSLIQRLMAAGATGGGTYNLIQAEAEGKPVSEVIKSTAVGTIAGGTLGAVAPTAAKAVGRPLVDRLATAPGSNRVVQSIRPSERLLQQPLDTLRRNNLASFERVLNGTETPESAAVGIMLDTGPYDPNKDAAHARKLADMIREWAAAQPQAPKTALPQGPEQLTPFAPATGAPTEMPGGIAPEPTAALPINEGPVVQADPTFVPPQEPIAPAAGLDPTSAQIDYMPISEGPATQIPQPIATLPLPPRSEIQARLYKALSERGDLAPRDTERMTLETIAGLMGEPLSPEAQALAHPPTLATPGAIEPGYAPQVPQEIAARTLPPSAPLDIQRVPTPEAAQSVMPTLTPPAPIGVGAAQPQQNLFSPADPAAREIFGPTQWGELFDELKAIAGDVPKKKLKSKAKAEKKKLTPKEKKDQPTKRRPSWMKGK